MNLKASLLTFVLVVPFGLSAQIQNPIKAAKDAYNRAKQQAAQQQKSQQTAQQRPAYQPAAATVSSSTSGPDSSCCTAPAMKNLATQAGAVDMVGIKLGMTPQQATAAIKAHNPALRMYVVNLRLYHPGVANFVTVPHFIVATNNPPGRTLPVGQEVILLEFTTPPNSPLLVLASRYTTFAPTLAGNLVNELDKKYGPEYPSTGTRPRSWLYDSNGRPVTASSPVTDRCVTMNMGPLGGQHQTAHVDLPQPGFDRGTLDVDTYKTAEAAATAPSPECMPYSVVQAETLFTNLGPNSQMIQILVTITSGGLNYASFRSSHDWLQAEADAKAKAAHDAAAQRTGTCF